MAPFATARTQEQPRHPPTDKRVKKSWHVNTVEYYSATRRGGPRSVLGRWMNLEPVMSEVSQKEKNKYCILTNQGNLEKWY